MASYKSNAFYKGQAETLCSNAKQSVIELIHNNEQDAL